MNIYRTSSLSAMKQHPLYQELCQAFHEYGYQHSAARRLALVSLRVMLPEAPDHQERHYRSGRVAKTIYFLPKMWEWVENYAEGMFGYPPEHEIENMVREHWQRHAGKKLLKETLEDFHK